jgi:NarL family two-component system response regulator LiaR
VSDSTHVVVAIGRLEGLVSAGLSQALCAAHGVDVLASDVEPDELEKLVEHEAPRVVILGGAEEHALLVRLKGRRPAPGVLVLTRDPSHLLGTMLLAAGITCLAWNVSTDELASAVHLAAQGDSVFVSAVGQRVQRPSPGRVRSLTDRQLEVLEQLSKKRSDAAIALDLKISVATARSHVRDVLRKLNVRSRRDLAGVVIPSRASSGDGMTIDT